MERRIMNNTCKRKLNLEDNKGRGGKNTDAKLCHG